MDSLDALREMIETGVYPDDFEGRLFTHSSSKIEKLERHIESSELRQVGHLLGLYRKPKEEDAEYAGRVSALIVRKWVGESTPPELPTDSSFIDELLSL